MKKNNGFTLVELLVIIVILGVVTGIVEFISTNVINGVKDKAFQVTINNLEKAASSYLEEENDLFFVPDEVDGVQIEHQCITVRELIDSGFFEESILEDDRINEDDYIYLIRNRSSKALEKATYNSNSGVCKKLVKAEGGISVDYSTGYSKTKKVTIDYELKNGGEVYTFSCTFNGRNCNENNLKSLTVDISENGIIETNIVAYGKIIVSRNIVIDTIDNEPPEILFSLDGSNDKYVQSINNIITVNDLLSGGDTTTYKYVYSLDSLEELDDNTVLFENGKNYSYNSGNGAYYLIAQACDKAGNCTRKVSLPYLLDTTKPTKPSIEIINNKKFSYISTDNNNGNIKYFVSLEAKTPTKSSNWIDKLEKDITSAGTYYVWAMDEAGNISDSNNIGTYTVELSKGTGISSVTGAGFYLAGSEVSISATMSDKYTFVNWTGSNSENITNKNYSAIIQNNWNYKANGKLGTITCVAGKYLKANATSCATCIAGSYCEGGTYNFSATNGQGINACPTGYTSEAGASKCVPIKVTCVAGKYLKANATSCATCIAGSYCEGGTYTFSTTSDQGINKCSTGYTSEAGASKCVPIKVTCVAGKYLKANATSCATCIAGSYCEGGTYTFSTTSDQGISICSTGYTSEVGASSCKENTYYIKFTGNINAMSTITATYGKEITVNEPTCSVAGAYFLNWTGSGITTSSAKYGKTSANTSWSSTSTKVSTFKFKNLTTSNGATVTLNASCGNPFEYNGGYDINRGNGTSDSSNGWYAVLKGEGGKTYTFKSNIDMYIDVSVTGAGGGGSAASSYPVSGSGGGGGATEYLLNQHMTKGQEVSVTIGAGGLYGTNTTNISKCSVVVNGVVIGKTGCKASKGGTTTFGSLSALGGDGAISYENNCGLMAGAGGRHQTTLGKDGGTGGLHTTVQNASGNPGKAGNCAWGLSSCIDELKFGAGGGSGGARSTKSKTINNGGAGGTYGGGAGGYTENYKAVVGSNGMANTGSGGGGGSGADGISTSPYSTGCASRHGGLGGSGVVAIRLTP